MGWSEAVFIIESLRKEIEKLQAAVLRIEAALIEKGIISDDNSN